MFESFYKQLEEMSGGRIVIDMYPSEGLVPFGEEFAALRSGVLDILHTEPWAWGGILPVADVEVMVSLFSPGPLESRVLFEERTDYENLPFGFGLLKVLREEYLEKEDAYYIRPIFGDVSGMFLKEPITKWGDLKGRKVWVVPLCAKVLEPTGMVTANIPPEEIYTSLATGIIEGVSWGGTSCGWDMGWHEVTSYFVKPNIQNICNCSYLMSPEAWQALPDDIQAIVEAAIIYNGNFIKNAYTYRELDREKRMVEEHGLTVIQLPPEEIQKYRQWSLRVLEELIQVDEASREAGEIIKDWLEFFSLLD